MSPAVETSSLSDEAVESVQEKTKVVFLLFWSSHACVPSAEKVKMQILGISASSVKGPSINMTRRDSC